MRRIWVLSLVVLSAACGGGDPDPAPTPSAAAPTVAAVDAGFARLASVPGQAAEVAGARTFDPAAARLQGPGFAVSVPAVGRVTGPLPDRVAGPFGLDAGATPAAGHELLLVDLERTEGQPSSSGAADPLRIEVAGRVVRATGLLSGTAAVSVPTGTRPLLRITAAGRTQTLDLGTGRRGSDAIAGYYPLRTGSFDADYGATTGLILYGAGVAGKSRDDRLASVQLDDTSATLEPYQGRWAKPGRAFLVLDTSFAYGRTSTVGTDRDTVTVPASCFRLTGPAGTVPLAGEPLVLDATATGAVAEGRLVADVPASLRRVTLRFAFCGSVRTAAGDTTYTVYGPPAQTAILDLR